MIFFTNDFFSLMKVKQNLLNWGAMVGEPFRNEFVVRRRNPASREKMNCLGVGMWGVRHCKENCCLKLSLYMPQKIVAQKFFVLTTPQLCLHIIFLFSQFWKFLLASQRILLSKGHLSFRFRKVFLPSEYWDHNDLWELIQCLLPLLLRLSCPET